MSSGQTEVPSTAAWTLALKLMQNLDTPGKTTSWDGLEEALRTNLLPGQSKCQKEGQIRTLPSLTTLLDPPRKEISRGQQQHLMHMAMCLTLYMVSTGTPEEMEVRGL